MKPLIIIAEVLVQFTSVNTSASSALHFLIGLSSMLSFTFDIYFKNYHIHRFTRNAISAYMVVKPKYDDKWNIRLIFDYWRGKLKSKEYLQDTQQFERNQTKQTYDYNQKRSLVISRTNFQGLEIKLNVQEQHLLIRQNEQITNTVNRSETINMELYGGMRIQPYQQKIGQISLRLKKLLDIIVIKVKQVYIFGHSAATQLVAMSLDETLLNAYTGHARNSKSTNEYYVFAERLKDNEIATKLSDTRGQVECNPISSTHQR
ncbi:MAG: hypothetical protein EZS28_024456 [Streblomastix strix]|uniref:Uncharacterized protein n=1 Tax=Streblomastix strix TaxID=222440 RepID=A0A5J4VC44_9EUKA|nr:MAG: hypothetical protein EZS28_024456 [Streblomastix strix]